MVVAPVPQDPRRTGARAEDVERQLRLILEKPADTPREEANNLEAAYSILNDALQ